jgi:hypothetical protein
MTEASGGRAAAPRTRGRPGGTVTASQSKAIESPIFVLAFARLSLHKVIKNHKNEIFTSISPRFLWSPSEDSAITLGTGPALPGISVEYAETTTYRPLRD